MGARGTETGEAKRFTEIEQWRRRQLLAAGYSYVELELSGRDADAAIPGMRAHLTGCPACAEDHDSLHVLVRSEQHASR